MTAERPREGVILVCVLVCLSVSTAMVFAATRQSLEARRQGRIERQLRQTEWLLQAGIGRAAAELSKDIDYAGETWEPRAALPEYESVVVEIRVSKAAEVVANGELADHAAPVRSFEIIARLARGGSLTLRTQRSIRMPHSLNSLPDSSNPTASSVPGAGTLIGAKTIERISKSDFSLQDQVRPVRRGRMMNGAGSMTATLADTASSAARLETRRVGILRAGGVNPRLVVSSNLSLRPEGPAQGGLRGGRGELSVGTFLVDWARPLQKCAGPSGLKGFLLSWHRWLTPPAGMCRPFGAEELVIACNARRHCFIARSPKSKSVENVALRELGRVDFRLACLHPSVPE